jgi:hypothetical protein
MEVYDPGVCLIRDVSGLQVMPQHPNDGIHCGHREDWFGLLAGQEFSKLRGRLRSKWDLGGLSILRVIAIEPDVRLWAAQLEVLPPERANFGASQRRLKRDTIKPISFVA